MKILEIILMKRERNRDIKSTETKKDNIMNRINMFIDKIHNPKTTNNVREFLKSKLKDEINHLGNNIDDKHIKEEIENKKYEVYDRQTQKVVGGPYSTRSRASRAADKKDLEYGAYRYGVREIKSIAEAVYKLPLSDKDFEVLKQLMEKPIPAILAEVFIEDSIIDDELFDQIKSIADIDPARDTRPLIMEWIDRVMPDQKHKITSEVQHYDARGVLSPIHGYDPHMYKGSNEPITGNAYGRY